MKILQGEDHFQNSSSPWNRIDTLLFALTFISPFLFLFPYVVEWGGSYSAIGNDFKSVYFNYKYYLLDCLAHGYLPKWSPSEACGFPFSASPLPASYYPLNAFLAAFYKVAGGYSMLDHARFTILGISIFASGLYVWLRSLQFNRRACLVAALLIGISCKMTELLRFPNAVHTVAWYPWILWTMHQAFVAPRRWNSFLYACGLFVALLCFLTAGYPYFVYYALFLFVPYALLVLIRPFRFRILGSNSTLSLFGMMAVLADLILSLLLCSRYFLSQTIMLQQTVNREGKDLNFATAHIFSFRDTLGSFTFPPLSSVEGIFYFSMMGTLLVIFHLARHPRTLAYPAEEGPAPSYEPDLAIVLWLAVVSWISYGRSSALFMTLWHYMPGFSSLRVWGRLSIILLIPLAWLLARAYTSWESVVIRAEELSRSQRQLIIFRILAVMTVIMGIQAWSAIHHIENSYWTDQFFRIIAYYVWNTSIASTRFGYYVIFYEAAVTSACALTLAFFSRRRIRPRMAATLVIAFATFDLWTVGPWLWYGGPHVGHDRLPLDVTHWTPQSFLVERTNHLDYLPLSSNFSTLIMARWHYQRYKNFLSLADQDPLSATRLLGMINPQKIFFSSSIQHPRLKGFLKDASHFQKFLTLDSYNGDRLLIHVHARQKGYLSFIDNWDPHWQATVDGKPVPIQLLFGTFKSVPVAAGLHEIEFGYSND
jgi:hypothetical protein